MCNIFKTIAPKIKKLIGITIYGDLEVLKEKSAIFLKQ